jgi:ubiquinone/menaquinone biosynthesis C-methylase UbiE
MTDYLDRRIDFADPHLATAFDEMPLWSARFGTLLLDHLKLEPNVRLLDVACGSGFPLLELAQQHGVTCYAVGVDTWWDGLARAALKRRLRDLERVALVRGDVAHLPFASASFDLVTSNLGLNNFSDPQAAFTECGRVLRPGGRMVLTTNPKGHLRELYAHYRRTLHDLGLEARLAALEAQEAHRWTAARIAATLRRSGFTVSRLVRGKFQLRSLNAATFLSHYLTRVGFLDGLRSIVDPKEERPVFAALEARLDARARKQGELALTIPMLYVEARRRATRSGHRSEG